MKLKMYTDDECVEVIMDDDGTDLSSLVKALRFKATHIKAKADPLIFELAADFVEAFDRITEYKERGNK